MANRFSRYTPGASYSPESFRDMAVVPLALRQRHDAALAAQDDLLLQLNNIEVRDQDRDYFNQKRQEITGQVEALTNKINTIGAGDSNLMGEFRNMKRSYNKEVSLAGGIGQAADIRKKVDDTRAKYLEYGVKAGWSPKTAQENFDIDYAKFNEVNPSEGLGTEGFAFDQFNPTFAPKQVQAIDIYKQGQELLGKFQNDSAWQSYQPVMVSDGQGGTRIQYQQTGGKTMSSDNLKNLEAYENYINQKILNPDSDVRQSLRYSRPGVSEDQIVSDFLSESDFLAKAMRVKIDSNANTIQPPPDDGSGRKAKSGSENPPATLTSIPTGQGLVDGQSVTKVLRGDRIKEIDAIEASSNGSAMTEELANEKELAIYQQNRILEEIKKPEVLASVNQYIAKQGTGIKSVNHYNQVINSFDDKIDSIKSTEQYKNYQRAGGSRSLTPDDFRVGTANAKMVNTIKSLEEQKGIYAGMLDEAYNSAINPEDLQYSKLYTFGTDAYGQEGGSNKVKENIDKSVNNNIGANLFTYLDNSGGKFTRPGENIYVNKEDDEDAISNLKNWFANGNAELGFNGIIDMGSTGSSQLIFNYAVGTGDKKQVGKVSIDYDNKSTDTSAMDQFLTEIQGSLDAKGKGIVQSIIDNKQLGPISVDNREYQKKGFSTYQDKTIKTLANQFDSKYNNASTEGTIVKSKDYLRYPGREVNMILNEQGFNELHMKDGNNFHVLGAQDWLDKQFAKNYYDKSLSNHDIRKAKDPMQKREFVVEMRNFVELASGKDNLISIGNDPVQTQKELTEFIQTLDQSQSVEEQYQQTLTFYEGLRNKKIAHKNKKRFM